jgi:hypothetical protein
MLRTCLRGKLQTQGFQDSAVMCPPFREGEQVLGAGSDELLQVLSLRARKSLPDAHVCPADKREGEEIRHRRDLSAILWEQLPKVLRIELPEGVVERNPAESQADILPLLRFGIEGGC